MTENRDFKGVWIPKEIWLCKELSALDRVLLAEINSLDNENHCIASNEYFAEFCGVGVATITRSINKLVDMGYIEIVKFDGRHRVIKMSSQPNQNDEAPSSKRLASNIDNTQSNRDNISKDILYKENDQNSQSLENDFLASKPKKTKSSLYDKCYSEILAFTNNAVLQHLLDEYLRLRLQMKDKPLKYANQWKGILNKLCELASTEEDMRKVIQQSLEKGWAAFYPLKEYSNKKDPSAEYGEVNADKNRKEKMSGQKF